MRDLLAVQVHAPRPEALQVRDDKYNPGRLAGSGLLKSAIHAQEKVVEPRKRRNSLICGHGISWINFWTGEKLNGGETIVSDAPIEKMPLTIRARIHRADRADSFNTPLKSPPIPSSCESIPGADGSFTLYEDENDNYDYEKGVYSTIAFHWNDASA